MTGNRCVALIACLGILGLTWIPWSRWGKTSDAVICEFLEQTYVDLQELRDRNASEDEWKEFIEHVKANAAPHVKELSRSATTLVPLRQRLLFLTRDHLPKLVQSARYQRNEGEQEFLTLLDEVRTMLGGDLPESMQVSGDNTL